MPSLGPLEILVIFVVALLVFGPNKLPDLARQVGKGLTEFRRVQHHLRSELDDAIHSVMDDDKPSVPPVDPPSAAVEATPVEGSLPALPVEAITADSSEAGSSEAGESGPPAEASEASEVPEPGAGPPSPPRADDAS